MALRAAQSRMAASQGMARAASAVPASNPFYLPAMLMLSIVGIVAIGAPLIAPHDPQQLFPMLRLQPPGEQFPLGTDAYGRDVLSRLLHGARISLAIGIGVAVASAVAGLVLGLVAGYFHKVGAVIMRAMDGLMAIPGVLLAIMIVALWGGSLLTVLIAIAIPEIPRVTRMVQSVALSARAEPYVEAAIALGTPAHKILWRHLMPGVLGLLIVQGTYIGASAILLESILSFLGIGMDPQIATWGNMLADARLYIQIRPSMLLWPGLALCVTILCVNIIGDAAHDRLDPRHIAQRWPA